MVHVLPNGLAAQGIIGKAYFQNADFGIGLYGLAGWCLLGMVLVVVAARVRPAADDAVDVPASSRR